MQALYHSTLIEDGFQGSLNPGGPQLTRHLIDSMDLAGGATVLDIGCGKGQGLELLQEAGLQSIGVDPENDFVNLCTAKGFAALCANMEALPFKDGSVDAIICQCAWNLSDKKRSLAEFHRVLTPSGILGITDIFLHNPENHGQWPMKTCLNNADGFTSLAPLLSQNGFSPRCHEDHTKLLQQRMAEMIFAHGSLVNFWQGITGCPNKAKKAVDLGKSTRPGLFLITAQKSTTHSLQKK